MKRLLSAMLVLILMLTLVVSVALADEDKKSGAFTYQIKGNGTAVITGYEGKNEDVYVPRMLDGYSVSEIGENVFSDVGNVIITLPDTITVIGSKAFENSKAAVINIPDSVKRIGDFAFFECDNITDLFIPASVEFIGIGAFAGCDALKAFSVEAGNDVYATIDGCLFNKQNKELVSYPKAKYINEVPSGIESIGPYAFYTRDFRAASPEEVLPDTIKNIGEYAFYETSYYGTAIHLPANLEYIGDYAFACISYTEEKRESAYTVYTGTKFYCPAKLKKIGNYAFADAYMGCVDFGAEDENVCLTTIGDYAFVNARLVSSRYSDSELIFPSSIEKIGKGSFKNFGFFQKSSGLFSRLNEGKVLLGQTKITTIEPETFSGANCGSINFPSTVKEVKERAAVGCKAYLDFDDNCPETIGAEAFQGIEEGVWFGAKNLKTIGERAFYGASSIKFVDYSSGELVSPELVSLPSTVISIGKEAFGATGLSSLTIPASVIELGEDFCDRAKTILTVEKGSYAEQYALENGYQIKKEESTDTSWLNN